MRTILILALALLLFGSSLAFAADSAKANAYASGFGKTGSSSSFASHNTLASGTGTVAAGALATNNVAMSKPGITCSGGVGTSYSVSVDTPVGTVTASKSAAVSYSAVAQYPNAPSIGPDNSASTTIAAGSIAGGTGTSACAETSQTGNGREVVKDVDTQAPEWP